MCPHGLWTINEEDNNFSLFRSLFRTKIGKTSTFNFGESRKTARNLEKKVCISGTENFADSPWKKVDFAFLIPMEKTFSLFFLSPKINHLDQNQMKEVGASQF